MNRLQRTATLVLCTFMIACGGGAKQGMSKVPTATALPPANPIAVSKMAQGASAAKEPGGTTRALELLREAVRIDPNLWEAHYDLGLVLAATGDLKAAEASLAEARRLVPDQEDPAYALAEIRRRRREFARGAEDLVEFVRLHPEATRVRMLYATQLRDSGQVDKAMRELRDVLVRGSTAEAIAELALCHLAKSEREPAELLARQATDIDPKSAAAHRTLGLILLAKGDDALAFQSFQKATAADPKETSARMNMGVVLLRAGAYPKAEEQFRAMLASDKEDVTAQIGLAAALRGQADGKNRAVLDEARALLERVLAREPKNAAALFNLGVLFVESLKRSADAKPLFEKFLSECADGDPNRAEAQRYLAALSEAKGKP